MTLVEHAAESGLEGPWFELLEDHLESPTHERLRAFVRDERRSHTVYPPPSQVFAALEATPWSRTRVVLLGQDPYHGPGQAHGLCFSVPRGIKVPPSLLNIFKELETDLAIERPPHGDLSSWAAQGVLLLNTVLTVRAGEAHSHRNKGWESLTDLVIRTLGTRTRPVVFALFGNPARKKRSLIDERHPIVDRAHPSPLSAHRGFLGSRPFSAINEALRELGEAPIDWRLPS